MKTLKILFIASGTGILMNCYGPINKSPVNMNMPASALVQKGKYTFFQDRRAAGLVNEYYPSGELHRTSRYEDGLLHGVTRTWYASGEKESERNYDRGEKEDLHIGWWANGNKQFEYQFSEGLYHGTFKEWYENGKLLHVFEYEHGQELSAIGWRENGRTYINFVVRNGRKYGLTNARLCFSLKEERGVYR
jgi:antitoxin component YwqK of YwqJK toxin-antitoxin module